MKLHVISTNPRVRRAQAEVKAARNRYEELKKQLAEAKSEVMASQQRLDDEQKRAAKKTQLDKANTIVDYPSLFKRRPHPKTALRQLELSRESDDWNPLGLLGLYLEQHKEFHGRIWKGSVIGLQQLYGEMKLLFQRHSDEAPEAIKAVFSPKMSWAENKIGLLLSVDGYERYIVPAMTALRKERKHSGEQSEWSLDRTATASCEEVEL